MRRWKARAVAVWAEVKDVEVALGNGAVSSDDYCTIIKDCAENLEEMEQFTGLCLCRQSDINFTLHLTVRVSAGDVNEAEHILI